MGGTFTFDLKDIGLNLAHAPMEFLFGKFMCALPYASKQSRKTSGKPISIPARIFFDCSRGFTLINLKSLMNYIKIVFCQFLQKISH